MVMGGTSRKYSHLAASTKLIPVTSYNESEYSGCYSNISTYFLFLAKLQYIPSPYSSKKII
jgi:hypothetical protein